jgi:cobalamin biosynthesis protein CbiD
MQAVAALLSALEVLIEEIEKRQAEQDALARIEVEAIEQRVSAIQARVKSLTRETFTNTVEIDEVLPQ